MPRRKRSSKGSSHKSNHIENSLKLSDFADARPGLGGRMRKTVSNDGLSDYAKKPAENKLDELSWFERKLDEFSLDNGESCDARVTTKTPQKCSKTHNSDPGTLYPMDVWFLIARFIAPESIGTFARICRSTNVVVHTASFWCSLYFRFCCTPGILLPADLQQPQIERIRGVRTIVIRSLFHAYPPLIAKTKHQNDPHNIVGKFCVSVSHIKVKTNHVYKLKFCKHNIITSISKSTFLVDDYNNIFHNSEEGCSVLTIVTKNYQNIPYPIGLVVTRFIQSVGSDMCSTKLTICLDSKMSYTTNRSHLCDTIIVMEPVAGVSLVDWWHPKYRLQHTNDDGKICAVNS